MVVPDRVPWILGSMEYLFIAITLRSTLAHTGSTWEGLMDLGEYGVPLYCHHSQIHSDSLIGNQEFWGVWSTLLLPLFSDPLWFTVVALDSVPSMTQMDLLENHSYLIEWICHITVSYSNKFLDRINIKKMWNGLIQIKIFVYGISTFVGYLTPNPFFLK